MPEYATFAIGKDTAAVKQAIALALAKGRTEKPREWLEYKPYHSDAQLSKDLREVHGLQDRENVGIRIYLLRKLQAAHADHPGCQFLQGMTSYMAGQKESAEQAHLQAIHLDQGRTNITLESLRCLAQIHKDEPEQAAYCYSHVLRLDLANPRWLPEAETAFRQAKLEAEAQELLAKAATLGRSGDAASATGQLELPALSSPASEPSLRRKDSSRSALRAWC